MRKKRAKRNAAFQGTFFQGQLVERDPQVVADKPRSCSARLRGEREHLTEVAEPCNKGPWERKNHGHSDGEKFEVSLDHV
jgi:hypothetical protein